MPAATLPASTLHHEACDQSYEETTKILFRKHPQRMILEPFELSDIANAIRILGHPSLVCLSHLLHSLFFLSFIFFLPPYKPLPSNHATSPLPLSPMSPIPVSYVPPMVDMVDPHGGRGGHGGHGGHGRHGRHGLCPLSYQIDSHRLH